MKQSRVIQTTYKGYKFRSRLEARHAVFFDMLRARYEYEHEGFDLPSGKYLPDFWLPDLDIHVEVKPTMPTEEELGRCRELRDETERAVFISIGVPGTQMGILYAWDICDSGGGCGEYDAQWGWRDGLHILVHEKPDRRVFLNADMTYTLPEPEEILLQPIDSAVAAARAARFEHGETP